ncbi:MAG: hypothetical protein ABIT71_07300, partial [Vicinamibacteraceae bacterium]
GCYAPRWARGGAVPRAAVVYEFIEHDPAPRGSPHEPHGPGAADRIALAPPVLTANVENSRASVPLPQVGQHGASEPRTSVSNRCWHPSQRNS